MSLKFTIAAATLASAAAAGTGLCVDENCSCADVGADGHLNTGPLTEIKSTGKNPNPFRNCPELKSLDMPKVVKVGNYVFYSCPELTSVNMPVATTVEYSAFSTSPKLATVSMPEVTKIERDAFSYTALTTVNMPKVTTLGTGAVGKVFKNCRELTTVNAPLLVDVKTEQFRQCIKLNTVNMPSATIIGQSAFNGCTALKTVDMSKFTSIGGVAFARTAITTVNAPEATSIGNHAFFETPVTAAYVPKATIGIGAFPAGTVMASAPINNAPLLDVDECDKTTCSLVENSAGYTVIQVIHPANNDFETVCHDGQDYSKGAQNVAHTTAITKHCAMVGAECKCYKAGSHPNGAVPADVANTPAGWSGSSGTGTATSMDHSGRAGIEAALAAHEAINRITETDTAAANAIKVAAHTRDGTDYAAHDGHVY